MKAISFCLFGSIPMYCRGAIRNAELAPKVYPGWTPIFWLAEDVPMEIEDGLKERNADVRRYWTHDWPNGMFIRFLVNDLDGVDRYIVRDTDSRLNVREAEAVAEWETSGKAFHVMRDHPYHAVPVMGGLWGCRGGVIKDMQKRMRAFSEFYRKYTREWAYGVDQEFLMQSVWPHVKRDCIQHDSCTAGRFPGSVPFPGGMKLGDWRFAGELFDEHDNPDPNHWQMRINFMTP